MNTLDGAPADVVAAYGRLTPMQRLFATGLPTAKSQEQAALDAGYSAKTSLATAFKMATHPDVKVVTDYLIRSAIKSTEITLERCMQELSKLAFGDPRALFDDDGALKAPDQWPEGTGAMIAETQQVDLHDEDGKKTGRVNKLKFADKNAALKMAFQLIDAFPDKKKQVTHTHRVGVVVVPAKQMTAQNADALEGESRRIEQPARKGNAPAFMVRRVKALAAD